MSAFDIAAQQELEEVERQIALLIQRRDLLRPLVKTYRANGTDQPFLFGDPKPVVPISGEIVSHSRSATQKGQIIAAVARILPKYGHRHTRDLLADLESQGIEIKAANKLLALSAILSKDNLFVASRKLGWSLNGSIPTTASTVAGM